MPLEFTGEAPNLGGDSNTVNPFSMSASNPTASPFRSFGATPSFGNTSTWSQTPSFANTFSTPTPSKLQASIKEAPSIGSSSGQPTLAATTTTTTRSRNGLLSRSLDGIKLKRTAIFGADVAAHDVVSSYLNNTSSEGQIGEAECANKLDALLDEMAESHPEAMKFLQHVFEVAVSSNTMAVQHVDPYSYSDQLRAEPGEIPSETPDVYVYIAPGSRLYRACATAINNRLRGKSFYHYNSYWEIGADIVDMIANGATRAEVRYFLSSGAYGRFIPSTNVPVDVDQFVDKLYEIVLKVKKQFKDGWIVQGRDEASYFGQGMNPGTEVKPVELWAENRKEKEYFGLCCPYPEEDYLPHCPPPDQPFRLMDLPPELWNNFYRKALVPGVVSLESCVHKNPRGTIPQILPILLETCTQINDEAKDLLWENTWQVAYFPAHFGVRRSAINISQLPYHALAHIKHLVLLVDCIRFHKLNCDPTQLQALTSLQTLRIISIEDSNPKLIPSVQYLATVLEEIVTRIAASCDVHYGSRPGEEVKFTERMIWAFKDKAVDTQVSPEAVEDGRETNVARLRQAALLVPDDIVQGSESGKPSTRHTLPGDFKGLPKLGSRGSLQWRMG